MRSYLMYMRLKDKIELRVDLTMEQAKKQLK